VPFEEVRPTLKSQLETEKQQVVQKAFESRLRKSAHIEQL